MLNLTQSNSIQLKSIQLNPMSNQSKQSQILITKEPYQKIFHKCIELCNLWNIPISDKIDPLLYATPIMGNYAETWINSENQENQEYQFKVKITPRFYLDYADDEFAQECIIFHELCHTINGCWNHGKIWKFWINEINKHGYRINPKPYSQKEPWISEYI